MIVFAAIVPHPPYSVLGIGTDEEKERIKATLGSFDDLRRGLEKANPDTLIIISPHGPMERYNFVVNSDPLLRGSFDNFGPRERYEFKNDVELIEEITYACRVNEIFLHFHSAELDHGALVPLVHLLKNIKPKLIHMSFSLMTYEKHYAYGEQISNVLKKTEKRIAIIASGDLSHSLTPESPSGYYPRAKFFDYRVIEYLASNDIGALMKIRKEAIMESRECGMRSFLIMLGMIHDQNYKFNLLSYEGPFGIGYLTARFI